MMHLMPNYHFGPISSYVPTHMMGGIGVHGPPQQLPPPPQGLLAPGGTAQGLSQDGGGALGPGGGGGGPGARMQLVQACAQCQKDIVLSNLQFEPIQCGYACGHWFHRGCTGLTFEAYQLLRNEPHAEWICKSCENNGSRIWYIKPKGGLPSFPVPPVDRRPR